MSFDFRAARLNMVESQVRTADVTDLAITDAMREIPRETLVPPGKSAIAYGDLEVEYAPGFYMMRPRYVGKLLQALQPRAGERALCIAAPYAAAVLERMGLEVVRQDGEEVGKAPRGAFDIVLTEGAVAEVPAAWVKALADGGRLGVVIRSGPLGKTRLYQREGDRIGTREVFDATPPFLPGFQPKPQFAF
jgi:protein-L-isoaspartate(D-aspartate) O-methyltransferase